MGVQHWDVVIVGAGPAGGRVATHIAERGHSVLLLEEHEEIGRPFQCAGLVTPNAMKEVGLFHSILEEVDGALIHGPSGTLVPVGTEGKVRTYVVCRKIFDQGVVKQSLEAGADIWLNSKPTNANVHDDHVNLEISKNGEIINITASLLIGCDGAHSWTRRHFKMGKPKELMIGFQAEVVGYEGRDRWLEMFSGSEIAPGFFAWVIPSGNGSHRIGLWSTAKRLEGRSIEQCYDNLLKHPLWKNRFSNISETARYCGPVPSGMVRNAYKDRVILIGDSAGMAKPTTGGGIGPGFKQVDILVPKLSLAIESNRLGESDMKRISSSMDQMRRDQRKKRALRDAFLTEMDDNELERIFRVWARPEVTDLINEVGDIENPIPLGIRMLREVPEFRRLAGRAAKAVLWG